MNRAGMDIYLVKLIATVKRVSNDHPERHAIANSALPEVSCCTEPARGV